MSLEDFARINDNTNDGEPMPRELLTHIYQAIAKEELKISGGRDSGQGIWVRGDSVHQFRSETLVGWAAGAHLRVEDTPLHRLLGCMMG